jgi:two-component system sensor histidine kinase KdpD
VEELLRAGINVISTLNIQHLESLYDLVEQATGVRVKERVPDYVLAMADQLVNVDLSAEDLRERLVAGKVYPDERIKASLENFFTMPNLMRLRELTLGEAAHLLDRRRREQHEGEDMAGSERVMVCLSSRSPNPTALLRKAMRVANRLNAPWYAVYIRTPGEAPEKVAASVERQLLNALALAHQLGGVPLTYNGPDVVSTIAAFVKEYSITHIVIGRSLQPWYKRVFSPSILERLLGAVPGVDVLVVDSR